MAVHVGRGACAGAFGFVIALSLLWTSAPAVGEPSVGWGVAVPIETGSPTADSVDLAVAPSGDALAVWIQSDGVARSVWANRYFDGFGWGTATPIDASTEIVAVPRVAIASPGAGVAVWEQGAVPEDGYYAVYSSDWGWYGPSLIETQAGDVDNPHVAAATMFNPSFGFFTGFAMTWTQDDGTGIQEAWVRRCVPGCLAPERVNTVAGNAFNPADVQVAVDSAGDVMTVWIQTVGGGNNLYVRWRYGGTWSNQQSLAVVSASNPRMAMDASGNVWVTWMQQVGGVENVMAARFDKATGAWSLEGIDDLTTQASFPAVAVSATGDAVFVWPQVDGAVYGIRARRYDGATGTLDPAEWIESFSGPSGQSDVAMDSSGNAIAIWETATAGSGGRTDLYANRYLASTNSWGSPVSIETENLDDILQSQVGTDGTGNAIVVWGQDDDPASGTGHDNIWANRYARDTTSPMLDVTSPLEGLLTASSSIAVQGATEKGASVTVNGASVTVGPGGSFSTSVTIGEGLNAITVVATDLEGFSTMVVRQVMRDSRPPSLTVVTPPDQSVLGTRVVSVSGTVDDVRASGVEELTVNGYKLALNSPGFSTWAIDLAMADGPRQITAIARDFAGNIATVTVNVVVDTMDPSLALASPQDGLLTSAADVSVSGATEPGATVTVNGASVTVDPSGAFSTNVALAEGLNGLSVAAEDVAGNTATIERTVTRDSTPPPLTVNEPEEGATLSTNFVYMNGTTEPDVVLWVLGVRIQVDYAGYWSVPVLTLPEGRHSIGVQANDAAGNRATVIRSFTVDTVAPALTLTAPSDGLLTNAASVTVSGTTESGAMLAVNGASVTVAGDGSFSTSVSLVSGANPITIVATDSAGNAATVTRLVTRDSAAPSLAITSPADGALLATNVVHVEGTAEVGSSVWVNGVWVAVDGTGGWVVDLAMADGSHTITVVAADSAGNSETITRTVNVDTIAPMLTLTGWPPQDLFTNAADVPVSGTTEIGATVSVNGLAATVDGAGAFSTSIALAETGNTVTVVATDSAGNSATEVRTVWRDSMAPNLAVSSPSDGALVATSIVTVAGTWSDMGVRPSLWEPEVWVNGLRAVPVAGAWSVDVALTDGVHVIAVQTMDYTRNFASVSLSISVDTTAPSLTLTAPTEDLLTNTPTVTVSGAAEAGSTVTVDGSAVPLDASGAFSATRTLSEGAHALVVVATDPAGNANTVVRAVTVDLSSPTLTLSNPADGDSTSIPTITVSGTTEPNARLVVNGILVVVESDGTFSVRVSLSEGSNSIMATATDAAGNDATASVSVSYVNPAPGIRQDLGTMIGNVGGLASQVLILLAIVIVLLVLIVGQFVLYRKLRADIEQRAKPLEVLEGE